MLKRQRAPSPHPYHPVEQYSIDRSSLHSVSPHIVKRRRVDFNISDHGGGLSDETACPEQDEEVVANEGITPDNVLLSNEEYKMTNNFLHDLHILHRHRQMFSPSCRNRDENLSQQPPHDKTFPMEPVPHIPAGHVISGGVEQWDLSLQHDEARSVSERYEVTNRLLRSLFLSRKRELNYDAS